MSASPKPTERDRFWLDHEAAIESSGQAATDYATAQGLSLDARYQARKRLRSLGLMERSPAGRTDEKPSSKPVSFSKIELATPRRSQSDFRLSLPNDIVLE